MRRSSVTEKYNEEHLSRLKRESSLLIKNSSDLVSILAKIFNCMTGVSAFLQQLKNVIRSPFLQVWRPVFQRHGVRMPEQCPLHFARDLFAVHELAKRHYRANLWTCGICGKSFYREVRLYLVPSSTLLKIVQKQHC